MERLELLRASDYRLTPWKNGAGVTSDVLLMPRGATHEDFDVRLSLAPIVEEGPFSSFPGIDRQITLISAGRLSLVFGREVRELERLKPFYFDSVQAPVSRLGEGPVRVLNVMTRRGRWNAQVMAISGTTDPLLSPPEGGHVVLHAIKGTWQVSDHTGAALVAPGDTLLTHEEGTLSATCGREGEAIVAFLSPAFTR
ncbi:MAG: ves 2 [Xanthobacteraceae bacterium]|jgi:environmental stress-induced protein Ves|nr:ves 2 [Xanthobacteraceae bacterium]